MPTLFDPKSTYGYVLSTDRDKPKNEQVKFQLRAFSKRAWKEVTRLQGALDTYKNETEIEKDLEKITEGFDVIFDIVKLGLVGWSNWNDLDGKPMVFDLSRLDDLLTPNEGVEIMEAVLEQGVTGEDKKKLNSQSDSNTEPPKTATDVPDETNAKT